MGEVTQYRKLNIAHLQLIKTSDAMTGSTTGHSSAILP